MRRFDPAYGQLIWLPRLDAGIRPKLLMHDRFATIDEGIAAFSLAVLESAFAALSNLTSR